MVVLVDYLHIVLQHDLHILLGHSVTLGIAIIALLFLVILLPKLLWAAISGLCAVMTGAVSMLRFQSKCFIFVDSFWTVAVLFFRDP